MSIENKFKPLFQTLQQRNISVGISPRHIEAHSPDYCPPSLPPVDFSPSSPTPNSPVSSYRIISTEDSLIDEIDEYSDAIFNTFFKPKLFDKTGKIRFPLFEKTMSIAENLLFLLLKGSLRRCKQLKAQT